MYRNNTDAQIAELRKLIEATDGRFFHVEFTKKDGSHREMVGRIGVKKHLVGGANTVAHIPEYYTVFDIDPTKGYRNVNLAAIKKFKCGDVEWPPVPGKK